MKDRWVNIEGINALVSGNTYDALKVLYDNDRPLILKGKHYEARKYGKPDLMFPDYYYGEVAFVEV